MKHSLLHFSWLLQSVELHLLHLFPAVTPWFIPFVCFTALLSLFLHTISAGYLSQLYPISLSFWLLLYHPSLYWRPILPTQNVLSTTPNMAFAPSQACITPPPPSSHQPYQVWATVKRRLCLMLLLTTSLRKSRGELRGESLGDVAPLFPPTTPGALGGSSSRCMCSLNVRMQESISTLSSFEDIPVGWMTFKFSQFPFKVSRSSKVSLLDWIQRGKS